MTTQDGTQAIRRAAAILQRIARVTGDRDNTLPKISASMCLSRSTTHRILKCLTDTGLAAYDPVTRRYEIGLLSYELGLAVTDAVLDLVAWRTAADRIARRTEVTTYLMRRSGIEAVCVHKAEGTSVIRVIPVELGQRRYLGVGAGSAALLAALDDATVERIIAAIEPELGGYADIDADAIRAEVAETRATGFSTSRSRVYRAIFGLGMAIPSPDGPTELALSIAAHESGVTPARIELWKAVLRDEIERTRTSARVPASLAVQDTVPER